jgi:hypothetical protein
MRAKLAPQIQSLGLNTENFTIWLDSSQKVRKLQVFAQGSTMQVTSTFEVTAINQPVVVTLPPAAQTATVPAGALDNI